jgi:MFS family permease
MLFAIHSWPSVILSFVGGFLIDRVFGLQFGTILYGCIMTMGQLVFAIGATINDFWVMMLGRFIFGTGAEALAVAESKYAVRWFKDKELNTAFGLQLSFNRVESTICFLVMEPLYREARKHFAGAHVIGAVLFFSLITCFISLISSNSLSMFY